jgi:hypothetical protein
MTHRKSDPVRNPYRLSVEQFLELDGRTSMKYSPRHL